MTINKEQMIKDLNELMDKHPDNYVRMLHSKCYKDKYGKYVEYIDNYAPTYLSNPKYQFITKIYWVLHNITEFPLCKHCGKPITRNVMSGIKGYSSDYCSPSCSQASDEHQEKMRKLALEKYGCESIVGSKIVREKIINKFKENVKNNPNFYKDRAEKSKQSCMEKYGVSHPQKVKDIRARTLETHKKNMLKKYGVEFPLQSKEIMDKIIIRNREKYGTDFPLQNKEYQTKCCQKAALEESKQKRLNTSLHKYGVTNLFHVGKKKAAISIHKNSYYHLFKTTTIPLFTFDEYLSFLETDDGTGKLKWKCTECNEEFSMEPFQHYYRGSWVRCIKCHPFIHFGFSQGEKDVLEYVKSILPGVVVMENDNTVIKSTKTNRPLELDIWIPELKTAIEYQGTYWHTLDVAIQNDEIKRDVCKEMGIRLFQLNEFMWINDNIRAKKILKEFLTV